jgi:DivIVA domain-containing protein
MTSNLPPDGPVTAQDIRNVGFTRVKKGYDVEEVNGLLEQVSATLDALARAEGARRAAAASEPSNDETPAPLHDPEGAAQRLLAAAQRTADSMTADADEYAERVRREADDYVRSERAEADDYASRVKPEADDYAESARSAADAHAETVTAAADAHAETVTAAAERQAASLLSAAAEEAREAAEEARSVLVEDMATLQSERDALRGDVDQLGAYVKSERDRLLASLEDIRSVVASGEFDWHEDLEISSVGVSDLVIGDDDLSDDDSFLPDDNSSADAVPIDSAVDEVADEGADESASNAADLTLDIDLGEPDAAVFDLTSPAERLEESDELSAGLSVFDIQSEFDENLDSDPKWLEDLSSDDDGEEPEAGIDDVTIAAASIFDIEAAGSAEPADEGDLGGPPTQALQLDIDGRGEGDRFFDELHQVDAEEDTLGPLDEDTDAALSAFFEPEDDEDVESRWRDRFGPRS